jgi:hypothetical protein
MKFDHPAAHRLRQTHLSAAASVFSASNGKSERHTRYSMPKMARYKNTRRSVRKKRNGRKNVKKEC